MGSPPIGIGGPIVRVSYGRIIERQQARQTVDSGAHEAEAETEGGERVSNYLVDS